MRRSLKYGLYGAVLAGVVGGTAAFATAANGTPVTLVVDGQTSKVDTRPTTSRGAEGRRLQRQRPRHRGPVPYLEDPQGHEDRPAAGAPAAPRSSTAAEGRVDDRPDRLRGAGQLGYRASDFVSVSRSKRLPMTRRASVALREPKTRRRCCHDQRLGETVSTAGTVGELLHELGVKVGPHDRVSPAVTTPLINPGCDPRPAGRHCETSSPPQPVLRRHRHQPDSSLYRDQTEVVTAGKQGTAGSPTPSSTSTGSSQAAGVAPPSSPRRAPRSRRSAPRAGRSRSPARSAAAQRPELGRLASCESGGNWHINTGNGFYGGVQFDIRHLDWPTAAASTPRAPTSPAASSRSPSPPRCTTPAGPARGRSAARACKPTRGARIGRTAPDAVDHQSRSSAQFRGRWRPLQFRDQPVEPRPEPRGARSVLRSIKYGLHGAVVAGLIAAPVVWTSVDKSVAPRRRRPAPARCARPPTTSARSLRPRARGSPATTCSPPRPTAPSSDGMHVVLRRGRLLHLDIDGKRDPGVDDRADGRRRARPARLLDRRLRVGVALPSAAARPDRHRHPHPARRHRGPRRPPRQVTTTDAHRRAAAGRARRHRSTPTTGSRRAGVGHRAAGEVVTVQRVGEKTLVTDASKIGLRRPRGATTATLAKGTTKVVDPAATAPPRSRTRWSTSTARLVGRTRGRARSSSPSRAARSSTVGTKPVADGDDQVGGQRPERGRPDPGSAKAIAKELLAAARLGRRPVRLPGDAVEPRERLARARGQPGSGAYGIPQALPGSKMASAGPDWQDNAETQIKWGLGYIASRATAPRAAPGRPGRATTSTDPA